MADLKAIGERLAALGADPSVKVWAMIETARAVLDADKLAAASRDAVTRLAGFVFGPNDIARETRIRMQAGTSGDDPDDHPLHPGDTRPWARNSRRGPYSDFSNIDGFGQECAQARDLGFDGKTLIHPGQIEACNVIFTPPEEEIARARQIIAGVRAAGEYVARRDPDRRPDGGTAARRHGQTHHRHCRCDRRDGELSRRHHT